MGAGTDTVSTQTFEARKGMVDNQEAGGQAISTDANKVKGRLDWTEIFAARPELYPPGYDEAVEATRLKVEQRKMAAREKAQKPVTSSKTTTKRRKKRA